MNKNEFIWSFLCLTWEKKELNLRWNFQVIYVWICDSNDSPTVVEPSFNGTVWFGWSGPRMMSWIQTQMMSTAPELARRCVKVWPRLQVTMFERLIVHQWYVWNHGHNRRMDGGLRMISKRCDMTMKNVSKRSECVNSSMAAYRREKLYKMCMEYRRNKWILDIRYKI